MLETDGAGSDTRHLEGQQIGRYLVQRQLGSGGGASVFQAYDQVLGQTVALKVLPPNPDAATLDRFRREALLAGALRHPHIVRILQVGVAANGGPGYIAMDLVEGESLADLLARFGSLRTEESCNLLEPVARGLAFAHSHGVIHRDVKPSNILLRSASPGAAHSVQLEALEHPVTPLLSDFGVARFLDAPELTSLGRTVGTPAFMAPEQCTGNRDVDGRADIYALGAVLYRCVIGRIPFAGTTTQILHAHVYAPVTVDVEHMQRLPAGVLVILQRCLAKSPQDRYPDASELADALAQVAGRSPARPDDAAGQATATLTLASLPSTSASATTAATHVLVAGAPVTAEEPASAPVRPTGGQRRGWFLWAVALVLAAIFGALIGPQLMNGGAAVTAATPTPAALAVIAVPPEPTHAPSVTAALTYTIVHAAATILPTATPTSVPTATPVPSATPSPLPAPTAQPSAELPEQPPVDTPATDGVPRQLEPTVLPGGEPAVIGSCSQVVDQFFVLRLAQVPGRLAGEFGCPTGPATVAPGAWQQFARGAVIAPNDSAVVYVYYAETHEWEQAPRPAANDDSPGQDDAAGSPIAAIMAVDARRQALGAPLAGEATVSVVTQPFAGGMLMGNRDDGAVVILARSKLRF